MIGRHRGYILKRTFPKNEGDKWAIQVYLNAEFGDPKKQLKSFNGVTDETRKASIEEAKAWIDDYLDRPAEKPVVARTRTTVPDYRFAQY